MIFEREGRPPRSNPSAAFIVRELGKLRSVGRSHFAYLTAADGGYVQVAGSPGGMVIEKRDPPGGRHFRAYQATAVVPFPDGTTLCFSGSEIPLAANEWFLLPQVVAVFTAFLEQRAEPDFVSWRDITELLAG
jgi:hypothetical protein